MKKFNLSLLAASCLFAACNTAKIEDPVQYGTLSVALADEPVVEVVTKAATVLDKNSAEAEKYAVSVYDEAGTKQGSTVSFKAFAPVTLPLGTYYVTAENCTETEAEEGNGQMRLYGRSDNVELSLNSLVQTAEVNCEVVNSKVSVEFEPSSLGIITDLKVVLKGGTTDYRMNTGLVIEAPEPITETSITETSITETWFNPSTLSYTISGKFNGKDVTPVTGTRELAAKDNIKLLVKVNKDNGQLSVASITVDTTINQGETIEPGFNPYN